MKKLSLALTVLPLFLFIVSPVSAAYLERVSTIDPPIPPEQEGHSGLPAISYDGQFVAFQTDSLYFPTINACEGLVVKDRITQTLEQVNLDNIGEEFCQTEDPHSISSDGRYVVFPIHRNSVYLRDRLNQTIELISVSDSGVPAQVYGTGNPYVSGNGRYVVFVSQDHTLDETITIPNQGHYLIYLRDRQNNTTRLVSIDQNGNLSGGFFIDNKSPSISDDGRYIVWGGAYIKDLTSNTVTQLPGSSHAKISRDGSTVALVGGTNVFVFKTATQTLQQLPITTNNAERIDISDNGQFIVFVTSNSTSFPQGGTIVYDTVNEEIAHFIPENSFDPEEFVFSGNGRYIAAHTQSQFVPEDTNELEDVYLLDLTETPPPPDDPVEITFNPSSDTYVRSGQGNQNEGAGVFMRVQSSGSNRALVRFDQSAIASAVGSGEVLSAKLRLTISDNGNNWGTTGRTVDVHRLVADWAEGDGTETARGTGPGATWNCALDSLIENLAKDCSGSTEWEMGQPSNPSVHPWVESPTATQTIINNQTGVVEYDVTTDVQAFMNGTGNYGWIVKKTNEGQNGQVSFGTKESTSIPQLVITYQP